MSNIKFNLSEGLEVGPANIDSATGHISTTGRVYATGYYFANGVPIPGAGAAGDLYTDSNVRALLANLSSNINNATDITTQTLSANTITANTFIGDGSQLTGLPASYTDSNVADFLSNYTGTLNFVGSPAIISGAYEITSVNIAAVNVLTSNLLHSNGAAYTFYSNTDVAAYLADHPQGGTYGNANVAAYIADNPVPTSYNDSNVLALISSNVGSSIRLRDGASVETSLFGPSISLFANVDANTQYAAMFVGNTDNTEQSFIYVEQGDAGITVQDLATTTYYNWQFDNTGKTTLPGTIQFPDNTIQRTAYTGYSDSNVGSYISTYTGNLTPGNVATAALTANTLQVTGATTAANITLGNLKFTGFNNTSKIEFNSVAGTGSQIFDNSGTIVLLPNSLIAPGTAGVRIGGSGWLQGPDGTLNLTLNYNTPGDVLAAGNVTATAFIGDGSQLTGITGSGGGADSNWTAPTENVWKIRTYNGGFNGTWNYGDDPLVWFDSSNTPLGANDFRGAVIEYHAYVNGFGGGTIVGTITIANDSYSPAAPTHSEMVDGSNTLASLILWDAHKNYPSYQLRMYNPQMTSGSINLMIMWTARVFYGSDYWC